jgi:hypothetical protein
MFFALFVLAGTPLPATAAVRPAEAGLRPAPAMAAGQTMSWPVAGWLGRIFAPIRSALGNRTRMVQVATIGMAIGLFIMFSMGRNK